MGGLTEHVFGYGSLVADLPETVPATLTGYRRCLGVAADNREVISGYKRYLDPVSGEPPAVYVAFLDLRDEPGATVNGVIGPASQTEIAVLDRRERNYERVEVTDRVAPSPGRVWVYVGSAAGRERLRAGLASDTAVVSRGYVERIDAAFRALGPAEHAAFLESSDLAGVPAVDLDRVDVP